MLTCVKWEAEVVKCKIIKCYVHGRKLILSVHQDISRYLDKIIISKYTNKYYYSKAQVNIILKNSVSRATVTGWLCTKCGTLEFSGIEYEYGYRPGFEPAMELV